MSERMSDEELEVERKYLNSDAQPMYREAKRARDAEARLEKSVSLMRVSNDSLRRQRVMLNQEIAMLKNNLGANLEKAPEALPAGIGATKCPACGGFVAYGQEHVCSVVCPHCNYLVVRGHAHVCPTPMFAEPVTPSVDNQ